MEPTSPARKVPSRSPGKPKTTGSSKRPPVRAAGSPGTAKPGQNRPKRVKKKFKIFSVRLGLDMTFLFILMLLLLIGMLMMFSASYPSGFAYEDDSFFYLKKQLMFGAIGIGFMFLLSYFDYHHWHKMAYLVLGVALLMLIIVPFIPSKTGVHRWFDIGPIHVQPSEIAKFAVILVLADWGSRHFKEMGTFKYGVLPALILTGVISGLLLLEPHYSGVAIIILLAALMTFISGAKLKYFLIAGIGLAVLVGLMAAFGWLGYAMERLDGWGMALNPTEDLYWDTYQTRNSLYAIGSGGFWGLGLGMSRQKYLYIPEVQNDFVFAVVCEELGFIGAAFILILFGLLVWRGITLSMKATDKFGALLGIGLSAQIGIQVILNILVITDWMPNTGISLPFFSYGGSSLIMLLAQMGIVLSISRTSNLEKA